MWTFAVDHQRQLDREGELEAAVRIARSDPAEIVIERQRPDLGRSGLPLDSRAQLRRPVRQTTRIVTAGAASGLFDQFGAYPGGQPQVGLVDPALEIVVPGQESIHPRADRVVPAAARLGLEDRPPAVVADRHHRHLLPLRVVLAPPLQAHGDHIVAVGKAVGLDRHPVADDPLGGKPAAIDHRRDVLHYRSNPPVDDSAGGRNAACGYRFDSHLKITVDKGGRVSVSDWLRPCAGMGWLATPPRLPMPLPP